MNGNGKFFKEDLGQGFLDQVQKKKNSSTKQLDHKKREEERERRFLSAFAIACFLSQLERPRKTTDSSTTAWQAGCCLCFSCCRDQALLAWQERKPSSLSHSVQTYFSFSTQSELFDRTP